MSALFWKSPAWRMQLWPFLAVLAILVFESTITSLWYQAIFEPPWVGWAALLAGFFIIHAGSYLIARGMQALHLRMLARQAIFLAWIALAVFTSLKLFIFSSQSIHIWRLMGEPFQTILHPEASAASFFHSFWIILLVWRGVALARYPITLTSVQASFQLGLATLLLYGMVYAPLRPTEAIVGLYLYLFFGLTAMSMARIAGLSEARGGRIPRFGAGWVFSIVLAGLAVVGLSILLGWAAGGQVIEWIALALVLLFAILTALVLFLFSPVLIYFTELIPRLADLIRGVLDRLNVLAVSQQVAELIEAINKGVESIVPYVMAARGLILVGILVIVMATVLLALYLRNIRQNLLEEGVPERVEPGDSNNFLQHFLHRLRQAARGVRLRGPAQMLAAARIRRIYRQLMQLSQQLGAPRPPSTTPLEFLPRLTGLLPTEQINLNCITTAYLKIRYGAYPETREEVEAVETAWEHVRRQGRKDLRLHRQSAKAPGG